MLLQRACRLLEILGAKRGVLASGLELERVDAVAVFVFGSSRHAGEVVFTDEVRRMVDDGLGFVATVNADGTPNLSPKGTLAPWDDEHLVFADIASPNTSANLERNPAVEVNVVDPLIRRGYRFVGTAVVHRDGGAFEDGVNFYELRGTVQARARIRAVVVIAVSSVLPLRSPAYALGATEEELKAKYRSLLLSDTSPARPAPE